MRVIQESHQEELREIKALHEDLHELLQRTLKKMR
jgi:hypothetical protein